MKPRSIKNQIAGVVGNQAVKIPVNTPMLLSLTTSLVGKINKKVWDRRKKQYLDKVRKYTKNGETK